MNKSEDIDPVDAWVTVGGCLSLPVLIPASCILKGWVLSVLWAWFVVPTFRLPELALASAIGIATVVSFIVPTTDCANGKDTRKPRQLWGGLLVRMFLSPLIALAFGWVVHFFV